ncbi:MAG: glyoxylate/hydroxypyruvate reductase A [Rhizobiaceae bacterium]
MKGAILLAATGWDSALWARLFAQASGRKVYIDPDGRTDDSIEHAIVWKHQPGSLSELKNLKVIFSLGAGVDHVFRDPAVPDVPVVRVVSNDLTNRMSEYIVWQVLDHHRMGPKYRLQQHDKIWLEDRTQPAAKDVTVGMLGLGVLGSDAALKLKAMGFNVTGWSRSAKMMAGIQTFCGHDQLPEFLAGVDILVCLLPLTPATANILAMPLFQQLTKRGPLGSPVLINAGRGGLQNEADILRALDSGLLSAVSLDVFQQEPLPADSLFWSHPKVTLTPHSAAASDPYALVKPIVDQMDAFDRGEALQNLIDRQHHY